MTRAARPSTAPWAHRLLWATALLSAAIAAGAAQARAGADPLLDEQWSLRAIHAAEAHRVSLGAGTIVAVADSGIDLDHPDLAGNVIAGPDLIDGDTRPGDEHGHGTHVAGIIAARAGNGIGVAGAAPAAKVLAIRVLDADNRGTTSQEARGIDAAVAAGAQVINLSLSAGPSAPMQFLPDSDLVQATERAARAGVVVVAAAGNDNVPLCAQPILATKILCVGAVDRASRRASYSNYSLRVNVVAPGGDVGDGGSILSTRMGGGYGGMAGTSQATPHVAAAAALLVSLGLRGQQVVDRIEETATDLGARGEDLVYGHGLLDAGAAVAGLGPQMQPSATAAALHARAARRVRIASVRRRGVAVRCRASLPGRCTARVTTRSGRLVARGTRQVPAAATRTVRARLTPAGHRLLRRARRLVTTLRVSVPGAPVVKQRVVLVR